MEKILNEQQLHEKIEHCSSCLEKKFSGADGKKRVSYRISDG